MNMILRLPFLVILMGIASLAMLVPMALAVRLDDFFTVRVFLDCAGLFLLLTGLIALATVNFRPENTARSHLIALFVAFAGLPVMLAVPLLYLVPDAGFFRLYFEMVSCLTTTGATIFDDPARLSEPVHLWRALVGWLGGLLILVAAISIFAPLNLGGFEVYASRAASDISGGMTRIRAADAAERLVAFGLRITPIYVTLTVLLAFGLLMSGERAFNAVILAMATLSTSGITAGTGMETSGAGAPGEVLVLLVLILTVSRLVFTAERRSLTLAMLFGDKEFRLMLVFITVLPGLLFLRHWYGALEVNEQENAPAALQALWGSVFTTLSFLTTTGFVSAHWDTAQNWSGLGTPGLILLVLAVMGGGVATTAGGVKLLRIYALYKHGMREMQKLAHPSSVGGAGRAARHIRREGAYVAWLFFMLFAVASALVMLALSLAGLDFSESLVYAVAALSTTGPLVPVVLHETSGYADLNQMARAILCLAMIVGRMETLAIIALMNPEFWRR
ncbi:MAG: TrkH family potassium uptake protein [Rhodobacteraceae bacterium]|nr:TrkH family potassium uptake protein [Paracoccaceae bacterium]